MQCFITWYVYNVTCSFAVKKHCCYIEKPVEVQDIMSYREIFLKSTVERSTTDNVLNELNSNVARFTTNEKNLAILFVTRQVRTAVIKRETSLFNSFCSNVSKQVARFFVARLIVA